MSILCIVCHVVLFVVLADQVTSTSCHIRNTVVLSTTYLPTSLHWKKTFTVSIFHGLFIWCPVLENVRHSYILHDIFIILYAGMPYLIYLLFENSKSVLLTEIFLCRDGSLSQCAIRSLKSTYSMQDVLYLTRTGNFYFWILLPGRGITNDRENTRTSDEIFRNAYAYNDLYVFLVIISNARHIHSISSFPKKSVS
jgi:hypothetical protein